MARGESTSIGPAAVNTGFLCHAEGQPALNQLGPVVKLFGRGKAGSGLDWREGEEDPTQEGWICWQLLLPYCKAPLELGSPTQASSILHPFTLELRIKETHFCLLQSPQSKGANSPYPCGDLGSVPASTGSKGTFFGTALELWMLGSSRLCCQLVLI